MFRRRTHSAVMISGGHDVQHSSIRRLLYTSTALLAVVTAVACSGNLMSAPDQSKGVQVSLERDVFRSGDTVMVHVKNASGGPLTYPYGFCRTTLQQQTGKDWVTVSEPGDGCPLALGLLGTGAETTHAYVLPATLSTGRYRLLLPSPEPQNAQVQDTLPTPSFLVNPVTF